MNTQTEAERLADVIWPWHAGATNPLSRAAAELRRQSKRIAELEARNAELVEVLTKVLPHIPPKAIDRDKAETEPMSECFLNTMAKAALAKAQPQQPRPGETT